MLRLGLTGGIGAGKSTVTGTLAELGAVVVDADVIAREVVEPGTPGLDMLTAEFGEGILLPDGSLDRAALAGIAFADPDKTAALNAITHPLIGERTAELFESAKEDSILVHDMPLIVEGGMASSYHLVLVVDTPAEIRLERLTGQRSMELEDARARISRQATDDQRRKVADVLIDNSGDRAVVAEEVRRIFAERLVPFEYNLRTSTPVVGSGDIVDHRPEWAEEAGRAAERLRFVLGHLAVRVDHVGPTAVPGANAPDVIDLEVLVASSTDVDAAMDVLAGAGYVRDRRSEFPLLYWCDPARPLTISVSSEHGEEELGLLMAGVVESENGAPAETAVEPRARSTH